MADQCNIVNLDKRLWIAKLSLRAVSIILCLVIIGCCAVGGDLPVIYTLPPPLIAIFLWNTEEGITLIVCRRASYKGIHPGTCVGVDLILWLGLTTAVCFLAPGFGPHRSAYYNPGHDKPLFYASMALGILTLLIQIALFSIACNETHRHRKAMRTPPTATWSAFPNCQILPSTKLEVSVRYDRGIQETWL